MSTTKTATNATAWPRLAVADLLAHPGNLPTGDADQELTASLAAQGVLEPLYVATTKAGAVQVVDGRRRLAAAVAAGFTDVPVTYRPVLPIEAFTAHPRNARRDLKITAEYVASIRAEGVRVPLLVTRDGDGLRVIDGHRRLATAVKAGLTHLPYVYDERDSPSQFLDMITTARHREGLTEVEEAAALFAAHEAGADVRRIAKVVGTTQKAARRAVTIGGSAAVAKATAHAPAYPWTLDDLHKLTELDKADPQAAARFAAKCEANPRDNLGWILTLEVSALAKRRRAAKAREAVTAAGGTIRHREELSDRAAPLHMLRTADGARIDNDGHARCGGHVWVLDEDTADRYEPWCSAPFLHGHTTVKDTTATMQSREERAAVRAGNLAWDAAEPIRRAWISDLVAARTLSRDTINALSAYTTAALIGAASPVAFELGKSRTTDILAVLLKLSPAKARGTRASYAALVPKDPRRASALQWAAVAAATESTLTRYTWRTDGYGDRYQRARAGQWFAHLASLGCPMSLVEQAIIDDRPYDPAATAPPTTTPEGNKN